jgi:endonuclease YncB( thermonuclease family)
MIHLRVHRAARKILLLAVISCLVAGAASAAAVGDQVELNATHQAGIPFHQAPRATNDLQRVPDGTRAHVIDIAKNGQWLKLSLPDSRTGWVASRYVRSSATAPLSPGSTPAAPKPQRIEEGIVERVADGDTMTVITPNQTKLRIRMFGIDAPETPKGDKFPGQPFGTDAEAHLKQLVEGKRVTVEIYQVDRYKRLLSTIFLDGKDINLAMIEAGLHKQVEKAAAGAGLKTAPWLRHMVRQITIEDFPTSWRDATPPERSHDSRIYTERFMLRLDEPSRIKLQNLVEHFGISKADIIRQLLAQAKPEDFPKSWHIRAAERRTPQARG